MKPKSDTTKQPLEDVGLFPIVVDGKEYNNAEELFCNYTIPDRFVTLTMLDKMCKNQKAVNERKALLKKMKDIGVELAASKAANKVNLQTLEEVAKELSQMKNERKALTDENEKVKRLLHGLTPGGSEFYNDPEYCAKWIRENREENHYSLSNIIKNLKDERKALLDALEKALDTNNSCLQSIDAMLPDATLSGMQMVLEDSNKTIQKVLNNAK